MILLNGVELEFTTHPNGEVKVDGEQIVANLSSYMRNLVYFRYEEEADLLKLMYVKRYLDEESAAPSVLSLSYMPYSRVDKREDLSVFTLKYVAEFINHLNFSNVYVHEPHSNVTPALLNNSITVDLTTNIFEKVMDDIEFDKEKDFVFYMDMEDSKRYSEKVGGRSLVGFKHEEELKVIGQLSLFHKVVILTNHCGKGDDFVFVAEKLKYMGAGDIYLVAGHCEDAIFEGDIPESDFIKKVYTTDSIIPESKHEKVEIAIELGGAMNVANS